MKGLYGSRGSHNRCTIKGEKGFKVTLLNLSSITQRFSTPIKFKVRIPVLSVHTLVQAPRASMTSSFFTKILTYLWRAKEDEKKRERWRKVNEYTLSHVYIFFHVPQPFAPPRSLNTPQLSKATLVVRWQ